jgi:hypothetical protein
MSRKIRALLALVRPLQGYKACIVFLPALFHGHASLRLQARTLVLGCVVWWLASGIVYILNDLKDAPQDRLSPDRAHRPLASRAVAPWEALLLASGLLAAVLALLSRLPARVSMLVGIYAILNLLYTLGLKQAVGLRQGIIAIGFWLRLQTGAFPVAPIPLTPWASLFTLGLAYYLNSLKGLVSPAHREDGGYRFAMGLGAGLAGSLVLASLVAICLKRGIEGSMTWPELPPLLCLVGMHRAAFAGGKDAHGKEQATGILGDPITLAAIAGFTILFIYG